LGGRLHPNGMDEGTERGKNRRLRPEAHP